MEILYKPIFLRQYNKLSEELRDEVKDAVSFFRQDPWHPSLRLHKLSGKLKGCMSFSVNYKFRIVCEEEKKGVWVLLEVGDHDIYR